MRKRFMPKVADEKILEWLLDEIERYTAPKAKNAQGIFIWDARQAGGYQHDQIAGLVSEVTPMRTLRRWPLVEVVEGDRMRVVLIPMPEEGNQIPGSLFKFADGHAIEEFDAIYPEEDFGRIVIPVTEDGRKFFPAWCYFDKKFSAGFLLENFPK